MINDELLKRARAGVERATSPAALFSVVATVLEAKWKADTEPPPPRLARARDRVRRAQERIERHRKGGR